jgi:uncharacterized membrane protein
MEPYVRISLALEVAVVAAIVHVVSRALRVPQVRASNAVVGLAAVAVVMLGAPNEAIIAVLVGSLISPAILVYAHLRQVQSTAQAPIPSRYVVPLETHHARELVSPRLQLINLLMIGGTSLAYAVIAPSLPESIPVHWGPSGQPDRYGSPAELWASLPMMILYGSISWVVAWISSSERLALAPQAAEETRELQLRKRRLQVRMVEWIMLGANVSAAVAWLGLALSRVEPGAIVLIAVVVSTGSIIIALAAHLTELTEISDRLRELGGEALGTRTESWRWGGAIYYAPDDPAIWVPKRSGIGSTLNFARPGAWLVLGALLLVPGVIAILIALAPQLIR